MNMFIPKKGHLSVIFMQPAQTITEGGIIVPNSVENFLQGTVVTVNPEDESQYKSNDIVLIRTAHAKQEIFRTPFTITVEVKGKENVYSIYVYNIDSVVGKIEMVKDE